jgi:hypothetical protein
MMRVLRPAALAVAVGATLSFGLSPVALAYNGAGHRQAHHGSSHQPPARPCDSELSQLQAIAQQGDRDRTVEAAHAVAMCMQQHG